MSDVALADKYDVRRTSVLLSGTQALVRLLLEQRRRDEFAGLKTAGFVSGYRGSPLGGLDMELMAAADVLGAADVVFRPGLNEELAATAIWGSQQIAQLPEPRVQGVFGLWYGKGPGVDRSGDAMKHGNFYGVTPHGGVVVAFGDDHAAKSSTICHQSEQALAANSIPVLYPASVQEVVEYGLLAWALSRYSGLWVGLKCVNETAESIATVEVPGADWPIWTPAGDGGIDGPNIYARGAYAPQEDEQLVLRHRLPRAQVFARANTLDRMVFGSRSAKLGIVAAGKAFADVMDALRRLGIDEQRAERLGLAVYKVGMIWPLEPEGLVAFADGKEELLFIEEKRPFLEDQAKAILFNAVKRPRVAGKRTPEGALLLQSDGTLDSSRVIAVLLDRCRAMGIWDVGLEAAASNIGDGNRSSSVGQLTPRSPYFCSGCPHNRSTVVPAGSKAFGGIGCHAMATWMNRETLPPCQMGGEGANWIGISPFSGTGHIFQNLGDGTYAHSGLLAVRAAIAARVNITYKILYNDAVAMTGGQLVEGNPGVRDIVRQLLAEGVDRCVVVTDDTERYRDTELPPEVPIVDRAKIVRVQEELRDVQGVTAMVYDQTCAAEKRRRRKAGEMPDPPVRPFINAAVCEGCGDCSRKSNCVSVLPLETELGRKREIDQSSCNKDLSCIDGFCPSFVTVRGGRPRRSEMGGRGLLLDAEIPDPTPLDAGEEYGVLIAGVGGAGVITMGAVLAMAAHLEGRGAGNYNMTGLAQKGGAVFSHLRFAASPAALGGARIGAGEADLLLVADPAAASAPEALDSIATGRTSVVSNCHLAPLAQFQASPDMSMASRPYLDLLAQRLGDSGKSFEVEATRLARRILGDAIGANMLLIGYAAQKGLLPVKVASIERAIELNGVAVEFNLLALRIGRLAAHDPSRLPVGPDPDSESTLGADLDALIAHRRSLLTSYQNVALAQRYDTLVDRVRRAEEQIAPGADRLSRAVAINYAKLLANKDEYEVSRLFTDGRFQASLEQQFEGDFRVGVRLAPPLMPLRRDVDGHPVKVEFGPWLFPVMRGLAKMKWLRGTPFDPFGWTSERRRERALARRYVSDIEMLVSQLTADRMDTTVRLASLPDTIRGFGHVRAASIERADAERETLLATLN